MIKKRQRYAVLVAVAASLAAAAVAVAVAPAASAATPVRIMPLGDSITAGPGCWRAKLWHRLQLAGYTNIDFVGTQSDGGGCNPGYSYDFDHEGHGGFAATGIANNNQLPPWLAAARPDIVIMHLGTNDMWGGFIPLADKLTAFTKLVGQMRAQNPAMRSSCEDHPNGASHARPVGRRGRISTMRSRAGRRDSPPAQSPNTVADLWTGFDAVADTVDGVHPNDGGFQKMSERWYPGADPGARGHGSTDDPRRPHERAAHHSRPRHEPHAHDRHDPHHHVGGPGGCSAPTAGQASGAAVSRAR
jgi:lysophospholipase L1-like esterase